MVVILTFSISYSIYGILKGIEASEIGVEKAEMYRYYFVIVLSSVVYLVFMLFYKRIIKNLDKHLAQPLLQRLIHQSEIRKNALIVGAFLFTIGFAIQFTIALL